MNYEARGKLMRELCVECAINTKCKFGCKEFKAKGLLSNALVGNNPDEWLSVRENYSYLRDPSKITERIVNGMRQVTINVGAYKVCYT